MVRRGLAALVLTGALACVTEVHESRCSCAIADTRTQVEICSMDQKSTAYKRRPFWESLGKAVSAMFGGLF